MSNGETKNGLLVEVPSEWGGRPTFTDEQFAIWLESMRPHLAKGCSLYYAITQCALLQFKDAIYVKYREKSVFAEKIDEIRSTVGDTINNFHINEALRIADKARQQQQLTKEEYDEMKFVASKHRLAQAFFTDRKEQKEAKDEELGKIIEPKPATIVYNQPKEPVKEKSNSAEEQQQTEEVLNKLEEHNGESADEPEQETFDVA